MTDTQYPQWTETASEQLVRLLERLSVPIKWERIYEFRREATIIIADAAEPIISKMAVELDLRWDAISTLQDGKANYEMLKKHPSSEPSTYEQIDKLNATQADLMTLLQKWVSTYSMIANEGTGYSRKLLDDTEALINTHTNTKEQSDGNGNQTGRRQEHTEVTAGRSQR